MAGQGTQTGEKHASFHFFACIVLDWEAGDGIWERGCGGGNLAEFVEQRRLLCKMRGVAFTFLLPFSCHSQAHSLKSFLSLHVASRRPGALGRRERGKGGLFGHNGGTEEKQGMGVADALPH